MALTKGKIIGIIIIILILISVVVIYTTIDGGDEVDRITILTTDAYSEDGETGIEIQSIVETSGTIDANANIKIEYDGETVYSGTTKISNNRMLTKIPWENFAVGNEQYTIKISHGGKTGTDNFFLHQHGWSVCEQVTILPSLSPKFYDETNLNTQPKMNILLSFLDSDGDSLIAAPKDLDISLSIKHEDAAAVTVPLSLDEDDLRYHTYTYEYNYNTGGGNYTISAEVENLFVDSDSIYDKFDAETYTGQMNLLPFAIVKINGEAFDGNPINVRRNQEVDFDASDSVNDGEILSYEWDFDYQDFEFTVDATGSEVTNRYTTTGSYDIACRIKGDVIYFDELENEEIREENINSNWVISVTII
jgi:archaellum component FlaF (FlaF/FlaG flagellin family)